MFGNSATGSSSSSSSNNQGLSKGYTPTLSWPSKSGPVSSGTVTSGSTSTPNWSVAKVNKANAQTRPKWQRYDPSTDVISGSSVSKYSMQDDGVVGKKGTRPAQQGTRYAGMYRASSSDQSLPTRSKWSSVQSAAQNPTAAAKVPPSNGQGSSPFGPGTSFRLGTSASAPARKVLANRGSKAGKPAAPQRPFGANGFQGSNNPPSPSSMIRGRTVSWNGQSVAQGPPGFPNSDNSGRGLSPGVRYAPTRTYNIPDQYGGSVIRRLADPAGPAEEGTRKPQQTYTAPPRQREFPRRQQQSRSVHPKAKVLRIRPGSLPRKYLIIFTVFL